MKLVDEPMTRNDILDLLEMPSAEAISFSSAKLVNKNWAAITLFEEIFYEYLPWITELLQKHNQTILHCVIIDERNSHQVYEIDLNTYTLAQFCLDFTISFYAITSSAFEFVILKESFDHFVIAGNLLYVREIARTSLHSVRYKFLDDVESTYMAEVYRKYKRINGEIPVESGKDANLLLANTNNILHNRRQLSDEWISRNNYSVVPFQLPLSTLQRDWIAQAIEQSCFSDIHAVSIDKDLVFKLQILIDDIPIIFSQLRDDYLLITNTTSDFAILKYRTLYYLVVGSPQFVEVVTGESIYLAFEEFSSFINDNNHDMQTNQVLQSVLKKYSKQN